MKLKKITALTLVAASVVSMAACGGNSAGNAADDKTTTENKAVSETESDAAVDTETPVEITVSNWPDESTPEALDAANQVAESFEEKYPYITVTGDTYNYDTKTFIMKAAADQLPTLYSTWFTEISQIISQGYAADLTDAMKDYGYDKALNPALMDLVTDDEGRIYGYPYEVYQQGFLINKEIFEEAGLVNDDGTVMIPDTWEEVAEYSKIIKEKTGKAGLALPTTGNCGGWHFLNIAWAYGVNFEEQNDDGTWTAVFDTQETRDALQYIKDLKWEDNVLLDDAVLDLGTAYEYFGTGQAAMLIGSVPFNVAGYGMDNNNVVAAKMPKGPEGRYAQMGGNVYMISKSATPEQIDAAFKYLAYKGMGTEFTEEQQDNLRTYYDGQAENGTPIMSKTAFPIWTDEELTNKVSAILKDYANVDDENYVSYFDAADLVVKPEPAACAQQLYSVLDGIIQEVITNKDADVDQLVTDACKDFQTNYLDKME